MVNGNYIMYGDRPPSDSEIVADHVQTRTAERKTRRKTNRTANELQHSLAQLDNDTDSVKYEKRAKEPRLLRYVPTTDVEEHYVTDKFETYDLKPTEATPRRYAFKKKPKNPADGSVNYAYSRSSSSCSSPSGTLPPIAEHEQLSTYRRSPPSPDTPSDIIPSYETKLDKYFTKPREVKTFSAKGSHPDSLFRVPVGGGAGAGKMARALRIMRWPVALVVVCVALAMFVYFLMPDNLQSELENVNATFWESNVADADTHRDPSAFSPGQRDHHFKHDPRTPEIDFYDTDSNKKEEPQSLADKITDKTPQRKLPAPPVFPSHLTPEVQYGNENADTGNPRSPKAYHEANAVPVDSTLKPHITQKPEKPLAVYFKDGEGVTTTTTESVSSTKTVDDGALYDNTQTTNGNGDLPVKPYPGLVPWPEDKMKSVVYGAEPILLPELQEYQKYVSTKKTNVNFTSGHSNLFGISLEEAENMQFTTQSSTYNTRVSPTLPTWRDGDDTTTKKYPVNVNSDVSQCHSTSLPLCRGVLPYDLAGKPAQFGSVSVRSLLPHMEYVAATNCSARFRNFVCALLEPECSPPPFPPKMPCYGFCKAIIDGCESELPRELRPVFDCKQYSSANCVAARVPCFDREMGCGDGSCIPRDWLCDGAADCPNGEDETLCSSCEKHEFRCKSGTCINKRWVCDGYADCPAGDDESEAQCGASEPGEESAGSAPAPAVHRPNKLGRNKGDESSKELLITSDSNNALKRNFTRRPNVSRLTPYSPPMLQDPRFKLKKTDIENSAKKLENLDSNEDVNVDDLGFFDADKENSEKIERPKLRNQTKTTPFQGRAPPPRQEPMKLVPESIAKPVNPTKLDKTINKLERVIDGAALLKKAEQAAAAPSEDYQESSENSTATMPDKQDEPKSISGQYSAHASPCPSGELRCVDGRCITLAQLCDGTIDCSDHADEDNCYT
ncbi:uncharacterized protein isoform X2 [Choristoneura fumiferana]|uniref:uncharacterized protein isoform X2 n=1 Tax=Choristoneura fumiferana TaxID=7141 RepID=UPI003D15A421